MSEKRFSEEHEWIEVDGETATVGITNYAQQEMGELVFVELPETGTAFDPGDEAATIESVKAANEVYAPVAGEVTEVNAALNDTPGLVNEDAEGDGWLFRMKLSDPAQANELMSREEYEKFTEEG